MKDRRTGLTRRSLLAATVAAPSASLLGLATPAWAAGSGFPSKPIRFIVPFGPGSGTDTSARFYGRKLAELTGQPVVVENRPGGNGFIAVNQVLAAAADGYTVFIGSNSTLAVNVALFRKLPYDPVKDFAPLSMLMHAPALLVVPQDSPHQSVASLVAAAKANPGKLNYAAGSAGYQLMAELFNDAAQVQTTHVPFKSAAEALTGVASGLVDFTFADITAALPMVQGKRLRALAIAAGRRSTALPAVPTSAEAGIADVIASVWVGATVHAKTPPAEAAQLAKLFSQIKSQPETREFYARLGADATEGAAAEMQSFQKEDIERWKRIATKAKIELQE